MRETFVRTIRQFIAGSILYNQQVADRVGLRLTDMQCINVLDLMGPSTPGELARCTGLTTGGVTVMLDRLENAGYVKREPNPRDRRSVLVRLNPAKLKKVNAFYGEINEHMAGLLDDTPESELRSVIDLFSKMNAWRTQQPRS
ncbi:MarR family winged helix-turn-helix transcriptional regulator [Mycobacterium sp. UM_CSW]|uniref:MarR family winged helix-turn-helix transcriptional regulator n=1 Tax=Mycobacterium sp. UM_CSW TaxID=1370119 RepID=UPI0004149234|nr:MarR family winged helix-turn-helix transcriptional regulator [Mycobacterium sp. UM_CSW]